MTIGTNGQLLRVNSGATAPEWALGVNLQLNAQTATYTVVLGDAFKLVTMSVAGANEWHVPYYADGKWSFDSEDTLEDALAISSSCCAQVSYRRLDDSLEKARDIFNRLVES